MVKSTLRLFLVLFVFTSIWYTMSRVGSESRAVNNYTVRPLQSQKDLPKRDYLNVAAFNIAHGRGAALNTSNWDGRSMPVDKQRLDSIAAILKELDLDIVVLNEVDFSTAWSHHINQAKYIAERAGFEHVVEQRNIDIGIPFFNFKFGNAVLSKHPVVEAHKVELQTYSKWEAALAGNKDAVCAVIDTPSGKIGVLAIHFEHRDAAHRLDSAKRIRRYSEKLEHAVVAMGDFNSAPIKHTTRTSEGDRNNAISYLLDETIFDSDRRIKDQQKYYTFPAGKPDRIIDWILVNKEFEVTNVAAEDTGFSDHLMVTARLRR